MIPAAALDLCRRFEGLRLKAYLCPAGIPTVGYGTTGADVQLGMEVTAEWAEQRLQDDLAGFTLGVLRLCPCLAHEPDDRLGAIVDFAYNLGLGRLRSSTLRKKITAGDWDAAVIELRKWNKGGGRVLPGLVLRREAEAALLM
jgi:lysozyme